MTMGVRRFVIAGVATALIIGATLTGAPRAHAVEPEAPDRLISRLDAVALSMYEQLSTTPQRETAADRTVREELAEFYAKRGHLPIWVSLDGAGPNAKALVAEVAEAEQYGLRAKDYAAPDLSAARLSAQAMPKAMAEAELEMSRLAVRYAQHAAGGRTDPTKLSRFLDVQPELPTAGDVLVRLAGAADVRAALVQFHPQHEGFQKLLPLWRAARLAEDERPRVQIPRGPSLKIGDRHEQIPLVRARLLGEATKAPVDVTGSVAKPEGAQAASTDAAAVDALIYDQALGEAVKAFQRENGLTGDGVLGPLTRQALNGDDRRRAELILANLERWRWVKRDLGERHVKINIPEFHFRVFKQDRVIHEERIVVGKQRNPTPVFSDQMEIIEFNPYWYVPVSIATKEMAPTARRNPGALDRMNMEVVTSRGKLSPTSVNWSGVHPGAKSLPFTLRQRPGPGNALGLVKFLFPNHHAVYMHDTPQKSLFDRDVRAFSHGCMRVRNPMKFAEVILADEPGWSRARINSVVASGANSPVRLASKVPVHVTYFTAWVGEDGKLNVRGDIYGHDQRVLAALDGRPIAPDPVDGGSTDENLIARVDTSSQPTSWLSGFGSGGSSGGNRPDWQRSIFGIN